MRSEKTADRRTVASVTLVDLDRRVGLGPAVIKLEISVRSRTSRLDGVTERAVAVGIYRSQTQPERRALRHRQTTCPVLHTSRG